MKILLCLFLFIHTINCNIYEFKQSIYDGIEFELHITEGVTAGWTLELTFDDKVLLIVSKHIAN